MLVVDDEPGVCWSLATLLGAHGFEVATMLNGAAALGWLRIHAAGCTLALIDAKLPDMEGFDLAARIRGETRCAAPIIMVSGYFYEDDRLVQDTLHDGLIAAFLTKPFRHDQLLRTVHAVLSRGVGTATREPAPGR